MKTSTPRNAPCPCGSGRKFKQCCLGKSPPEKKRGAGRRWVIPAVIAAVLVVAVWIFARPGASPVSDPGGPAPPGVSTPRPYEYDAANDRHWDPGHGHWHQGPPPAGVAAQPQAAPHPYEYDAANDRHWDPDHGHWHQGPPPGHVAPQTE